MPASRHRYEASTLPREYADVKDSGRLFREVPLGGEVTRRSVKYSRGGLKFIWDTHSVASNQARHIHLRQGTPAGPWAQLGALKDLAPDWNGYGAEAPSDGALASAHEVISVIDNAEIKLDDIRVLASAAGGVVICSKETRKYAEVEILNSGSITLLTQDLTMGSFQVFPVSGDSQGLLSALRIASEYLNG